MWQILNRKMQELCIFKWRVIINKVQVQIQVMQFGFAILTLKKY